MILYLVQHGTAKAEAEDPARPLAPAGREEVKRLAAVLTGIGTAVTEIRHSGKRRAQETAEILAAAVCPAGRVVAASGLAPNDPVESLAAEIGVCDRDIMLVGHLPHLARLAAVLLAGRAESPMVRFVPGTLVRLERGAGWSLAWCLPPELTRALPGGAR